MGFSVNELHSSTVKTEATQVRPGYACGRDRSSTNSSIVAESSLRKSALGSVAQQAWKQSGRKGDPRIVARTYFAPGPSAEQGVRSYLGDYHAFLWEWVDMIIQSALTTMKRGREALPSSKKRESMGWSSIPTIADLDQIDRLAEAVL